MNEVIIDDLDRRILTALQDDASQTNHQLAERVHASAPTCLRRVKRLVDAGVIARQVVLLTPEKLGPTLTAVVELRSISRVTSGRWSLRRWSRASPRCCNAIGSR